VHIFDKNLLCSYCKQPKGVTLKWSTIRTDHTRKGQAHLIKLMVTWLFLDRAIRGKSNKKASVIILDVVLVSWA